MNFKDMLDTLSLLSEATRETEKGRVHKAEPGGYGRKYDTDEEGEEDKKSDKKKAEPAAKRGRGRPKKGADDSGEVKSYSGAKDLQNFMIGNVPKKSKELEKLPSKKHSLKDWIEQIDKHMINEAEQVVVEPAKQSTQVIKQGTKTLGTVSNPALAATIKSAIGKGEMNLSGDQLGEEAIDEKWTGDARVKPTGEYKNKSVEELKYMLLKLKKSGPHDENSPAAKKMRQINFALRAKGGWKKGEGAAMKEADIPSDQVDMGAGLGAGRNSMALESKAAKLRAKFDKLDEQGVAEGVASTRREVNLKKKINESVHKHHAAKLIGKAHALAKEGYNCKYEDIEEAKAYHEGFKEGLDECYGMAPIQGIVVGEGDAPAVTVPGMAQQAMPAMEADVEEGNAFTAALARADKGEKFNVGGKTFVDRSNYDAKLDEFAFESLDKQLNFLLNESEQVDEGLSVSISSGQQGAPDSVTVSAQDAEAEKLMNLIKHVGLGVFGEEQQSDYGAPADVPTHAHGDIAVVDDHDGMMNMMKKMASLSDYDADYKDENSHEHNHEETCNECGYMESACKCESEIVDEVETPNQMTDEVAEGTPQEAGAEEEAMTTADENAEARTDMALANAVNEDDEEASEEGEQDESEETAENTEEVTEDIMLEEWANEAGKKGTDTSFIRDIDFMTKVIAGGLNKPKVTGQTTIPVIANQGARNGSDEDVMAWKKLAGIMK